MLAALALAVAAVAPVPRGAQELHRTGPLPRTQELRIEVVLRLRHRDALNALLEAQQDRSSPQYHRWLQPAEFAARFGADLAMRRAVTSILQTAGLRVEDADSTAQRIGASGSATSIERLFATTIGAYAGGGATYYANDSPARRPKGFPADAEVLGLDNIPAFSTMHTLLRRGRRGVKSPAASGSAGGFTPHDLAVAYDYPWFGIGASANGSSKTIGIIMEDDFLDTDLAAWNAGPNGTGATGSVTRVPIDGGGVFIGDLDNPNSSLEVTLDVEQSTSLAPGANELVYETPDLSGRSFYDALFQAVVSDVPDVVSMSFGGCENGVVFDGMFDELFAEGNAQGQAFFAASGDSGSSCNGGNRTLPSYPASDPIVVAVGGSTLYLNDAGRRALECGWVRSGGGYSSEWPIPPYQYNYEVYNLDPAARAVPDIAFNADPLTGNEIYFNGTEGTIGGTSLGAPDATAAWVDALGGRGRFGQPDNELYPLGQYGIGLGAILCGYNGAYADVPGYNAVTGLGSFDWTTVANYL
jgi:kumamolisin